MFLKDLFINEMTRKPDAGNWQLAMEELWPLCFDLYQRFTTPNEPLVVVDTFINEVKIICIDQIPLSCTREILLDIENPDWRNDDAAIPRSFIWRGDIQQLRLHPKPDDVYSLWMLVQKNPLAAHKPQWFNLVASLRAVENLSLGSQTVGRIGMVEFARMWREAFFASIS
jgi:hypothetical protein